MGLQFVTPAMWEKFEAGRARLAAAAKKTETNFPNFKEVKKMGKWQKTLSTQLADRKEKILYPTDPVNKAIWWPRLEQNYRENIKSVEVNKGENTCFTGNIYVHIWSFGSVSLGPVEKRIMIGVAAAWKMGIRTLKINSLVRAVGYNCGGGVDQSARIIKRLESMKHTQVIIDNSNEAARCPGRKRFMQGEDLRLLPIDIVEVKENGKTWKEVKIEGNPPLMKFAESRGQCVAVDPGFLQCGVRATDKDFAIADYLLERIHYGKTEHREKISLESILLNAGEEGKFTVNKEEIANGKNKKIIAIQDSAKTSYEKTAGTILDGWKKKRLIPFWGYKGNGTLANSFFYLREDLAPADNFDGKPENTEDKVQSGAQIPLITEEKGPAQCFTPTETEKAPEAKKEYACGKDQDEHPDGQEDVDGGIVEIYLKDKEIDLLQKACDITGRTAGELVGPFALEIYKAALLARRIMIDEELDKVEQEEENVYKSTRQDIRKITGISGGLPN